MMQRRRVRGFTLIELMIAVAIIGILAAVGYPSYLEHIRKSKRAEVQQSLMNAASRQQQFLLDTRNYAGTLGDLTGYSVPPSVSATYSITLAASTSTVPAFTLTAAPQGSQAQDKCGTLTLNNNGVKTPANCW